MQNDHYLDFPKVKLSGLSCTSWLASELNQNADHAQAKSL
ncbi:hypothetical protein P245_22450 [Comamonas thiooxydans]|uniref:Uncharacterized protein n=1 Tax=Comamonas thiooxydans TaxID=363952 RepID=A0A0E3BBT4_9BURK|nr:hypothetical protein P245_22450 [Comamonas thiooxydans]